MSAKPLSVTVLSPLGEVLGTMLGRVTNSLWRATREAPKVQMRTGVRACERHGEGWAIRLLEGERMPRTRG